MCVYMHESLEELSLWKEVVSRLSKSHLGTLRGGKPLEEGGRQRPQFTRPRPPHGPAHTHLLFVSARTDSFRRIQSISSLYTREGSASLSRCLREAWVALINKNNCFLFSSHLTSCMVNTGKCFRNESGNLCFIRDALHLVLADLPLA